MSLFTLYQRLYIRGVMPERALLRLRRAGIAVYDVKKVEKNEILLSVKKKDTEKVFAIYPDVCYNISVYNPYVVKKAPAKGVAKWLETAKKRVGLLLGALLFAMSLPFADRFVFDIEFVGTGVYAREAYIALEEAGIRPFAPYVKGKEDTVCAKLLALDNVEFCSVKKTGFRVQVEIRTSPFSTDSWQDGEMVARHAGELLELTVLKGTPLKNKGDPINAGEPLVGNWFSTEDGGQVRVQSIARARIACTYEEEIAAEDEEQAFAVGYLNAGISERDTLTERSVTPTETAGIFRVKLCFIALESINF